MSDKNGKTLQVGDEVKVFTYTKGVVVGFAFREGAEMAIVKAARGQMVVCQEEIEAEVSQT